VVRGNRPDTINDSDDKKWELSFTLANQTSAVHGKDDGNVEAPDNQHPSDLPSSLDQTDEPNSITTFRENLSRDGQCFGRVSSTSDQFEDHWSRLCEMDWNIVQDLPCDLKRRLGEEWESDDLDPIHPDGDWSAPLHLYLSSPAFVALSWSAPSSESGVPSTLFFKNSGLDESWCFITYCFPRRLESSLDGADIGAMAFGKLYELYLRQYLPKCLEKGGEVVLVYGKEAKAIFQELLWTDPRTAERPTIVYGNVKLDVEIVTYKNSKLSRKAHRRVDDDLIRHLIIYVPDPCPFTSKISDFREDNDPIRYRDWAIQTRASLDYAVQLLGRETHHSYVWNDLAQHVLTVS